MITLEMTNNKVIQSRQAYSLFNLLEGFGGFNGSVYMILKLIMSAYSVRIYND